MEGLVDETEFFTLYVNSTPQGVTQKMKLCKTNRSFRVTVYMHIWRTAVPGCGQTEPVPKGKDFEHYFTSTTVSERLGLTVK